MEPTHPVSPGVHRSPTDSEHDREVPENDLLSPLTLRGVTFRNRIAMSPMCQYMAREGMAHNWHLVHLGSRAVGGAGFVCVEATAVTPQGRISPADVGLWSDAHAAPLATIAAFVKEQGAVAGIQLAHAGRKGSSKPPWEGGGWIPIHDGGWEVVGPSALPFDEHGPEPKELSDAEIEAIIHAFEAATRRAVAAGFQVIELHAAHGYLLHEFLSPLSNRRTDRYGGDLENRIRLVRRVADRMRQAMPDDLLLFTRISATDWVEGAWDIEQAIHLAGRLADVGVDLVDVSSGGSAPRAHIPVARGYQVPFARRIRDEAAIPTAAVGLITETAHADEIITGGDADLVMLGRELLREPYWALKSQHTLDQEPSWPVPYGYAVKRRAR
jgi:2,4-dienoyl-CoA reductase-like NADH-dependent reductase (Old Yellow Enzyme family)